MNHYKDKCLKNSEHFFPSDIKPYRHFFCRECKTSIKICVSCDRGQIYCLNCQKICKKRREKDARTRYKKSSKGLKKKQEQNQRRYKRLTKQREFFFQGDRGSPSETKLVSAQELAVLPVEGEKDEVTIFSGDQEKTTPQRSKKEKAAVFCSFCCQECAPYARPPVPWRQVCRMWFRRWIYSKGGSDQ
jgi:hypothetical protein